MGYKRQDEIILGGVAGLLLFVPQISAKTTELLTSILPDSWMIVGPTFSLALYGILIGSVIGYYVGRT